MIYLNVLIYLVIGLVPSTAYLKIFHSKWPSLYYPEAVIVLMFWPIAAPLLIIIWFWNKCL